MEDKDNFFNSKCMTCPQGLVGGHGVECIPCPGGSIWQEQGNCKTCASDKICPIGTKFEFDRKNYGVNNWKFPEEVHYPKIYEASGEHVDNTVTFVLMGIVSLSVILAALIGIFHNSCKEKSLFICRELDVRTITGGDTKKFVGGVIICFYILWVSIFTIGFLVYFFAYNSRIDFATISDRSANHNMKGSF